MPISFQHTHRMLNVGCGQRYHPSWTNLDLIHSDSSVLQHDLLTGLPFDDNHFDVVYHSHVLEHLSSEDGAAMIRECFRVLKPGGIMRVVVPDLEQIARLYLQQHDRACQGDEQAKANYDWMKLELLDQMVRQRSGGAMAHFITGKPITNPEFVLSRLGCEFEVCVAGHDLGRTVREGRSREGEGGSTSQVSAVGQWWYRLRKKLAIRTVRILMGRKMRKAFEEVIFRSQGEVHRWMYDRYSLQQLCTQCGFVEPQVCTAFDSQIENFAEYELDSKGGLVRKPDSLFFECGKLGARVQDSCGQGQKEDGELDSSKSGRKELELLAQV